MRLIQRIRCLVAALARGRRHRGDFPRWLARRPQLALATGAMEAGVLLSNRVEPHLKSLAEIKTAAVVACEFCLDFASAVALGDGVSEEQLRALPAYSTSEAFDDDERLVLRLVDAMTATPAVVTTELRDTLLRRFSMAQVAELATAIAWENHRARLNTALGIRAIGVSDATVCALPEIAAPGAGGFAARSESG